MKSVSTRTLAAHLSVVALALFGAFIFSRPTAAHADCASTPAGLISWWRGEDNALDSIGDNDGTLMNGASFAAGALGRGFSLNGEGQYVEVPDSASLTLTNEFTLAFWYVQSVPGDYAFIAKRYPGYDLGPCNFGFNVNSGIMFLYFLDPEYPWNFRGIEWPAPSVGVFHHLAGSYRQVDADNVEMAIFIDGQLITTQLVPGNLARCVNDTPVTIGADNATGFFLNGIIDEVSIYGRALSACEVQAIYNAGMAGNCGLLTERELVSQLIAQVETTVRKPQPLLASLNAAAASLERCNIIPAINQLEAFKAKVRAQVMRADAVLAGELIQAAQNIIDALHHGAALRPHRKFRK